MKPILRGIEAAHAAVLLAVLAAHGAALYGLSTLRVMAPPPAAAPVFVSLLPPQSRPELAPRPRAQASPQPRPATGQLRQPRPAGGKAALPAAPPDARLAASAPAASSAVTAGAPFPSASAVASPESGTVPEPGPAALPASGDEAVSLASDLAVVCAVRPPPPYPPVSRRLAESGRVVLRVELDASGRVGTAQVTTSSGYRRLDAAAVAAVMSWRCQPAQRNGQPVRAVAVQPFDFILEER